MQLYIKGSDEDRKAQRIEWMGIITLFITAIGGIFLEFMTAIILLIMAGLFAFICAIAGYYVRGGNTWWSS